MSEIATKVLPQASASIGAQQSARPSREAATSAGEGSEAFSRVLDQQLSNRREATRSEDAARQRRAEGEAPREQAAARRPEASETHTAKAATADEAGKAAKAPPSKDAATARSEVPTAAAAAVEGVADGRAAAAIAALLPGLAAAPANDAGTALATADGMQAGLNADADASAKGKVLVLGAAGALRAGEGSAANTGDKAAPETEPGEGQGFRARLEQLAVSDAAAGPSARLTRSQAAGEPIVMAAVGAGEATADADPLPAAAGTGVGTGMGGNDGNAALMSMQAAGGARAHGAAAGQPMPAYIATPAGQPGWAEDVGNRVVLLAGRDESAAELILTPPQLGRVEVSIRVSGEQTTAHFVAATPAARDALEQAMPRLREVLAEAGISLGDANVNTQAQQQRGDGGEGGGRQRPRYASEISGESPVAVSHNWLRRSDGLIDTFA